MMPETKAGDDRVRTRLDRRRVRRPDEGPALSDQLLGAFSHELRTPLNAIVGHADLLCDALGPQLDDDAKRSLDVIIRSAMRLTNLVNDTIDLARLRIGTLRLEVRRFDAAPLIAEVSETFAPLAAAKGLTMTCRVLPAAIPVETDAHRLRQTLRYVIDNAIKFTARGEVRVCGYGTDDALLVEIFDTGIGIRQTDRARVFEDFHQVDGSSTRSYDGCGLGLAISRRLVTMMGGTIDVESEPGRGSCFCVSVPRRPSRCTDAQ